MSSQQHNPNLHHDTTVYQIGKRASWMVAVVFMLMLIVPPVLQHVSDLRKGQFDQSPIGRLASWRPGTEPLMTRLHSVEKGLDASGYSTFLRQSTQEYLTREFAEGTRKSFIGFDGYLFYAPDLKSLTGFGPLKPEPFSVMKDPELAKLPESRDVIIQFGKQLAERGVKLVLVPLPLKSMLYPENVDPRIQSTWVTHPDAPAYYQQLRKEGVEVLDLTASMALMKGTRKHVFQRVPDRKDKEAIAEAEERAKETLDPFLRQDTHWTPEGMRRAAELVAQYVKENHGSLLTPSEAPIRAADGVTRRSMGDLVNLMGLKDPATLFNPEEVFLRVIGGGTESKDSPVVLLGDSFVNIYNDPNLGFDDPAVPNENEQPIRAGFAQHLSLLLQQPLDVMAMNARGSTQVRREFARRPDDVVRSKKIVIWAIAARDVLLSRTAAHQANIEWAHVEFNPNSSQPTVGAVKPAQGEIVVEVTMTEKSKNQDPTGTPYTHALHGAVYKVDKVVTGEMDGADEFIGVQWTFKNKVMQPTASFSVGKRYRLTITPWEQRAKQSDVNGVNLEDTSSSFSAERWFVEKAEELP